MILVGLHGNAVVESGFSVKGDIVIENLYKSSLAMMTLNCLHRVIFVQHPSANDI